MAKIPIILEPGRADGKLVTSGAVFDENKNMFQSELNDVQDTLSSDNPNKPLSAKQGKVLKELLDTKVIEAGAVPIDTKPIEGNITHVVSSDGLAKEFNKCSTEIIQGGVYDVSAHNNNKVFESLQALLNSSDLSTLIPESVRHGGMSIRFIQSSVNKYVQYRLMSERFNTTIANWQGVDDEPTANSNNLVKSVGVYNTVSRIKGYTVDDTMNSFLKFVSIDLSGYNGSTSISELSLLIWNGRSNLYGFQIYNGNKRWIEKLDYPSTETCYLLASQGVKVYIEVDKSKMQNDLYKSKLNEQSLKWDSRINTLESSISKLNTTVGGLENIVDNIYGTNAVNQISGLNTTKHNQAFLNDASVPQTLRYAVSNEVDTISPFKDILGYGIRLIPQNNRDYYYNFNKIDKYPPDIYFSYWVRGDEVKVNNYFLIGWGFMDGDYNHPNNTTNLKSVVDYGVGYSSTMNITKTNFSIVEKVDCVFEKDGWYQIIEHFAITWNETANPWAFGLRLAPDNANALPFTIINPQITFIEPLIGVCVLPDILDSVESYPTSISQIVKSVDALNKDTDKLDARVSALEDFSKKNTLHISFTEDADSYIISPFNDTYNIKLTFKLKRAISPSHNKCFNFQGVILVDKATNTETNVHSCYDDICPSNFNGTYLGGNHGNANIRKLTITNHGLTHSNIGEIWTYGTNGEATILGILDSNNIIAAGKNTSVYPKFSFPVINANEVLSHNGSSLTVSASEYYQWFSSTNQPEIIVLADGEIISENGDYGFNTLKICEAYDIMNTASQVAIIQNNVGTYTSTPNPINLEGADKVARHSIIYQFESANQWFIATTFTAYQDINLSRFGYTQQNPLDTDSVHLYIPKTLPVVDDASTIFDFRTAPLYTSHTGTINIISTYWENPNLPPDRWLTYNDNIAIHSGFLYDYGIGGNNRKDCIYSTFYLPSATNKIYINGIDEKLTIHAGDSYSGINWRTYIDRTKVMTNGVILVNKVEYDNKLYIYADFNQTGIYEITIPDSYLGRTIAVFEKSDNITLLTPISNRKVLIKMDTANPMYGYLVAQIKK